MMLGKLWVFNVLSLLKFIFNWRKIALQYCVGFWNKSIWISHRYTYVPSLLNFPPISHFSPHPTLYVVTEHWFNLPASYSKFPVAILHVVLYMLPWYSLNSSHPLLSLLCPQVCSLCLCLPCCPANRFISIICSGVNRVHLFVTPWAAAHQASLALTISQSLPKFDVHWIGDAIQLSHPLPPASHSAINLSQHQSFFQRVSCSYQMAKYWSFSFSTSPSNEYSGFISLRIDWFDDLSRFHIYALIYNICFSLSNFTLYNKL